MCSTHPPSSPPSRNDLTLNFGISCSAHRGYPPLRRGLPDFALRRARASADARDWVQAFFELFNRLLIDARGTAIVLHILKRLPYESFGNVKWLGCHARLLPLTRLALPSPRMTPPLCSAAITAASTLLRAAPSLDGALLLSASSFGLVPFASHRRRRFPQFNIRARSRLALPLCRTPSGP